MELQVLGVGFGRTGTLSLKAALEHLGFGPCHHMMEVLASAGQARLWARRAAGEAMPWSDLLGGYRSVVDWPGVLFWRELVHDFPTAKVILTERDPQRWYDSISQTIFQALSAPPPQEEGPVRDQRVMAKQFIVDRTFGAAMASPEKIIAVYQAHNAEVRRVVPPERLLVYNVQDGWAPLCAFLGVPVPDKAFPHANSSEEFRGSPGRGKP